MTLNITPYNNNTLCGHALAEARLHDIYKSGYISGSWLVHGRKGIGKATLIYKFIKFLFSLNSDIKHVSALIEQGYHPDLLVIDRESNKKEISVEEIRKVRQFLSVTPTEALYRVVIIDSCEYLSNNAANALLKVLEEPPANGLLFIISHIPGKLPVTIVSRCRRLRVKDLSTEDALSVLRMLLPDVDDDILRQLLILSDGSPAVAMEIYAREGLQYYQKMVKLYSKDNQPSLKEIWELVDSKNNDNWYILGQLLNHLLVKLIKTAYQVPNIAYLHEQEFNLIHSLLAKTTITKLLELYKEVQHILHETIVSNLDHKQSFILIYNTIRSHTGLIKTT